MNAKEIRIKICTIISTEEGFEDVEVGCEALLWIDLGGVNEGHGEKDRCQY